MRAMVISDLHYDRKVYKGVDESRAWGWLLGIVDYHRPDLLISLGDWGGAVNPREFYELLRRVRVWSIYGNHDNLEVLGRMYNVLAGGYEPVLMRDGEVREFDGLRFGAINGIVALGRRMRRGVPRKRPEEFVEYGRRLRGKVDVLLLHDSPKLPLPEYSFIAEDGRAQAVGTAIYEARPEIVFCGHIHIDSPYTIHRLSYGTLYIRADSSQRHRCYALLDTHNLEVEIWRDTEKIYTIPIKPHKTKKHNYDGPKWDP